VSDADYALVGDIGGTNARFALVRRGAYEPEQIRVLATNEFANLDTAVSQYLTEVGVQGVDEICVAIAGPVQRENLQLTNSHWHFTRAEIMQRLGLSRFKVINDFTAMALGVPHVDAAHLISVGQGNAPVPSAPRLIIGPGTGLGVAGLLWVRDVWIPLASEGGHVDFAPTSDVEMDILRKLQAQYGRVSVERILSGAGLVALYQILSERQDRAPGQMTPANVTQAAMTGEDSIAVDALQLFCEILGRVAGNAALTLGAQGGVFICGGIVPRFIDFFRQSRFEQAFLDKGRMRDFLRNIPIQVVTHPHTGLLGASEALLNPEI